MTKRDFGKTLTTLRARKTRTIDLAKVRALALDDRWELVRYIVRNRGPVLQELLDDVPDAGYTWLAACGYLHRTRGPQSGLTFLHTAEHSIR